MVCWIMTSSLQRLQFYRDSPGQRTLQDARDSTRIHVTFRERRTKFLTIKSVSVCVFVPFQWTTYATPNLSRLFIIYFAQYIFYGYKSGPANPMFCRYYGFESRSKHGCSLHFWSNKPHQCRMPNQTINLDSLKQFPGIFLLRFKTSR